MNVARYCLLSVLLALPGCRAAAERPVASPKPARLPRQAKDYPWPREQPSYEPIAARFPTPQGFERAAVADGSWGQWLRHLPLRPAGTPVTALDGTVILPGDSPFLAGVVDMDVRKDQECADVILRLRAEYLRWGGRESEIIFRLTDGGRISWAEWKKGMRPRLKRGRLRFRKTARPDASRGSFDRFLAAAFAWCGTYSLSREGRPVKAADIQIGDFFVHPADPGHAVLVVDLAKDAAGHTKALLLQGYMPAQSAHVLSPGGPDPWFDLNPPQPVDTPIWGAFEWGELRRFGKGD